MNGDLGAEHEQAIAALESGFGELFSRMRRMYADAAAQLAPGLQPTHFKTFSVIARLESVSVSALAAALDVDKAQASRTVRELEATGLVFRTADPLDRRMSALAVTDHGRQRLHEVRGESSSAALRPIEGWSDADIANLARLLHALVIAQHPDEGAETASGLDGNDREAAIASLGADFSALFARVRRIFRDAAETVSPGLQRMSYQALSRIARADAMTASALAKTMATDKSVISRALRELASRQLIERTTDPNDRRSTLIVATPLGIDRLSAARDPMRQAFRAALAPWPIDDVRALTRLLAALSVR